jgi:hypothetical protein
VEDDVLFLLGPGMGVMARYVAPEELLEVIKLNELASEAQRSKAAAEAAVEAVEQVGVPGQQRCFVSGRSACRTGPLSVQLGPACRAERLVCWPESCLQLRLHRPVTVGQQDH